MASKAHTSGSANGSRKQPGKKRNTRVDSRVNNRANNRASNRASAARQASLTALRQVLDGQSLSSVQRKVLDKLQDQRDRALANEIVNGVLRWRWRLDLIVSQLMSKPLKAKDSDVQLILWMALYELQECRTPDYAIINDAVELVRTSGRKWAASLVNAVLRRFTREQQTLLDVVDRDDARYSHPDWLLNKIKQDWPDRWQSIVDANNQRPALWLRVNRLRYSVEQYRQQLQQAGIEATPTPLCESALKLARGIDVRQLPGFAEGAVSVQDAGAQLAVELLPELAGQRVLDLCAAPGGKSCHILESNPSLQHLSLLELDEQRMLRVQENLQRLGLVGNDWADDRVECITADAREYEQWWDSEPFQHILLDAPCSASGVIRRHPDIKSLRRGSDIEQLVLLQAQILEAAWQMLAVGGELLYVTCSVFKDENQSQINNFIALHDAAEEIEITADWGQPCEYGRQLLPGEQDADGFYFCRLRKIAREKAVI